MCVILLKKLFTTLRTFILIGLALTTRMYTRRYHVHTHVHPRYFCFKCSCSATRYISKNICVRYVGTWKITLVLVCTILLRSNYLPTTYVPILLHPTIFLTWTNRIHEKLLIIWAIFAATVANKKRQNIGSNLFAQVTTLQVISEKWRNANEPVNEALIFSAEWNSR
jgi:hypothetical protein